MKPRVYANVSNGLAFPHDDVCFFQSQHGHARKCGYYRIDAMPLSAVVCLLRNQPILVVDATHKKNHIPDGLRFGLTSWVLTYNRAIGQVVDYRDVAPWATLEMMKAANYTKTADKVIRVIRRVARIVAIPTLRPVIMSPRGLVWIKVCTEFPHDDKPDEIGNLFRTNCLRWR